MIRVNLIEDCQGSGTDAAVGAETRSVGASKRRRKRQIDRSRLGKRNTEVGLVILLGRSLCSDKWGAWLVPGGVGAAERPNLFRTLSSKDQLKFICIEICSLSSSPSSTSWASSSPSSSIKHRSVAQPQLLKPREPRQSRIERVSELLSHPC